MEVLINWKQFYWDLCFSALCDLGVCEKRSGNKKIKFLKYQKLCINLYFRHLMTSSVTQSLSSLIAKYFFTFTWTISLVATSYFYLEKNILKKCSSYLSTVFGHFTYLLCFLSVCCIYSYRWITASFEFSYIVFLCIQRPHTHKYDKLLYGYRGHFV